MDIENHEPNQEEWDFDETPTRPSKSQKKREMTALQGLGEQLLALSKTRLKELELDEALIEAIEFAKKQKLGEARRRQIQYIGVLMRELDPDPIKSYLEEMAYEHRQKNQEHQEVESWRERLISGDNPLLQDLKTNYPELDVQRVKQLARNASQERKKEKPPKAYRELFKYLKTIKDSTKPSA